MMLFQQQQVDESMSNLTSASGEASGSSGGNKGGMELPYFTSSSSSLQQAQPPPSKKKRNLPGNPDPEAEVIALSPKTLVATNRFVCEICNKGFQRDQNLQLHRRGHNLPWKLKQRSTKEVPRKKVYVCPEPGCVHHDPARALGDLTGIKKHFSRKHGDKKWKCDKCSKRYAVHSDWKAHSKTCGTREYRCDCGTIFSRRDSFITHRAFCDALAEESARAIANSAPLLLPQPPPQMQLPSSVITPMALLSHQHHLNLQQQSSSQLLDHASNNSISFSLKKEPQQLITTSTTTANLPSWLGPQQLPPHIDHHHHDHNHNHNLSSSSSPSLFSNIQDFTHIHLPPNPNPSAASTTTSTSPTNNHHHHHLPPLFPPPLAHMSATALLQKAAQMGATMSSATAHLPQPHQDLNLLSNSSASHDHHHHHHDGHDRTQPNKVAPQNSILHDVMMMSSLPSSDSSSSFDNNNNMGGFGGVLNNPGSTHQENSTGTGNNNNGDHQGLTRDFLGLRPLSHSDILSLAGLGNTINISSDHQNNNQPHKPW